MVNCKKCGRVLTNPKSIELGYGKTCYRSLQHVEPEVDLSAEIEFLKCEINMLKRLIRNASVNGFHEDPIERIKKQAMADKKDIEPIHFRHYHNVIIELKEVLEARKVKIEQSTNLELPPHVVMVPA